MKGRDNGLLFVAMILFRDIQENLQKSYKCSSEGSHVSCAQCLLMVTSFLTMLLLSKLLIRNYILTIFKVSFFRWDVIFLIDFLIAWF